MAENYDNKDDDFIVRFNEEQEKTLWKIVGPLACRAEIQEVKTGASIFGISAPIGGAAEFIYGAIRGLQKHCIEKKLRPGLQKEQKASEVRAQSESESG